MLQTRRQKNNAKIDARQRSRPDADRYGFSPAQNVSGGWPRDWADMAERVQAHPGTVPNYDRDLLAKGAPLGTFTRRDGTSFRPQFRDANA